MSTDVSSPDASHIARYGTPMATYHGAGRFALPDGQVIPCSFEAGQLATGQVLLLCEFPALPIALFDLAREGVTFQGETIDGWHLTAARAMRDTNYLPDSPRRRGSASAAWAAFALDELQVRRVPAANAQVVRFGLTNIVLRGVEAIRTAIPHTIDLPLDAGDVAPRISLRLEPVPNYAAVTRELRTRKHIAVTCELAAELPASGDAELTAVVENVCHLLSVATGTKIQWVYRYDADGDGAEVARHHASRITKPYTPLPIVAAIDARDDGITKRFIETTYATFAARRSGFRLDRGTIDAYLDAKAEGDYLEGRGVKVAVAPEMLKAAYLASPDAAVGEYILDSGEFEALLPILEAVVADTLRSGGVDGPSRQAMLGALRGLNRTSFRRVLNGLFGAIDFRPPRREIDLFIACRNSLVHQGRFYCETATPEDRRRCEPLATWADEYLFLVNVLDRVFLRLLGYVGPYIDWREAGNPTRREHA